eukprot:1146785-Pelagomonas_calceolata.AAC.1
MGSKRIQSSLGSSLAEKDAGEQAGPSGVHLGQGCTGALIRKLTSCRGCRGASGPFRRAHRAGMDDVAALCCAQLLWTSPWTLGWLLSLLPSEFVVAGALPWDKDNETPSSSAMQAMSSRQEGECVKASGAMMNFSAV